MVVHTLDVTFSQMFSGYYLQDHETVTTEHLWRSHLLVSSNHSVMGLYAHCDSLTDDQRLLSAQSLTATTNHLWWSHLFVSQAWKVSLTPRHHCSCKTKRSCTCSPECQVHHFTYVLQYIIVRRRVQRTYKPKRQSCSEPSIVRALLRVQRFLNHVDPIGQKCLAYLEYNRCQERIFKLNYRVLFCCWTAVSMEMGQLLSNKPGVCGCARRLQMTSTLCC